MNRRGVLTARGGGMAGDAGDAVDGSAGGLRRRFGSGLNNGRTMVP
jgi:hypothetical protein